MLFSYHFLFSLLFTLGLYGYLPPKILRSFMRPDDFKLVALVEDNRRLTVCKLQLPLSFYQVVDQLFRDQV